MPFNEALRTISSCIKHAHINLLPFLAGIKSLKNRCHYKCDKFLRSANNRDQPLHQMMHRFHKLARLRSRHPLRNHHLTISAADNSVPGDLAEFNPQWWKEPSGCKLPRKQWSSSIDCPANLDKLLTTCIGGAFPKRVHMTMVQKSRPTPTSSGVLEPTSTHV